MLASFDAFLRTGELLSLQWSDVRIDAELSGAINFKHTTCGQRHAVFEAAVIFDPMVGKAYLQAKAMLPADTSFDHFILAGRPSEFYTLFYDVLRALGLESFGFRPYSVRRGGATAYYRATRSMEATIEGGRWASTRVARIYVNDGLAREIDIDIPLLTRRRLRGLAHAIIAWTSRS